MKNGYKSVQIKIEKFKNKNENYLIPKFNVTFKNQ